MSLFLKTHKLWSIPRMYSVSDGKINVYLPTLPSALPNVLCQKDIVDGEKKKSKLN